MQRAVGSPAGDEQLGAMRGGGSADAADDEVFAAPVLDLHPRTRSAVGCVCGVEAFGHDALKAVLARDRAQLWCLTDPRRRNAPARAGWLELVEHLPALMPRQCAYGAPIRMQDVEDDERRDG